MVTGNWTLIRPDTTIVQIDIEYLADYATRGVLLPLALTLFTQVSKLPNLFRVKRSSSIFGWAVMVSPSFPAKPAAACA